MQIHLQDLKSANDLQRPLVQTRLQLYMNILEELEKSYWGADRIRALFEDGQNKITRHQGMSDIHGPEVDCTDTRGAKTEKIESEDAGEAAESQHDTELATERFYHSGDPETPLIDKLLTPSYYH